MAESNFFLKEPKSENETLGYLFFSYNNKRLKYSTSEKIHPDYWNKEKQRAKNNMPLHQASEFNSRLDLVEGGIKTVFRRLQNDGNIPSNQILKTELEKELNEVKRERITFFAFIDSFIEEAKALKAPATIKAYNNCLNHLKKYCKVKGKQIDFDDINLDFYTSFISYLTIELKFASEYRGKPN